MAFYSLFYVLFFQDEIKFIEEVACGALICVAVLVVWLLAMVSVVVGGWYGVAVFVSLSRGSLVVILEVIVDFSDEEEGLLKIGLVLVSTFGVVSKDLENAA